MEFAITLLVTFFAGMGAGLGTGFAGMSAAAVISPMLITFLGMEPYMAVGIALSSDVLASAVSAYTYGKNKNLDIRNGLIMMASVLAFTVVGSYIASLVPSATMGGFSVFMTFLLGVKFIVRPVMTTKEAMAGVSAKKRAVQSILCGVLIGFICGFIGAGGGMMMLLILTSVLGYELKTAVGTSVFIMAFTEKFESLPYTKTKAMRPLFANAAKCEPDSQGRILLPQKLRAYAGLDKDVVIIGVSNRAEIWNAERWAALEAEELNPENLAAVMEELGF